MGAKSWCRSRADALPEQWRCGGREINEFEKEMVFPRRQGQKGYRCVTHAIRLAIHRRQKKLGEVSP